MNLGRRVVWRQCRCFRRLQSVELVGAESLVESLALAVSMMRHLMPWLILRLVVQGEVVLLSR